MNDSRKKILINHYDELENSLGTDLSSVVWYLWHRDILTQNNKEEIWNQDAPFRGAQRLLNILIASTDPDAYGVLLEAATNYELVDAVRILQQGLRSFPPANEPCSYSRSSRPSTPGRNNPLRTDYQQTEAEVERRYNSLARYSQVIQNEARSTRRGYSANQNAGVSRHPEASQDALVANFNQQIERVRSFKTPVNVIECILLAALENIAEANHGAAGDMLEGMLFAAKECCDNRKEELLQQRFDVNRAMECYVEKTVEPMYTEDTLFFQVWVTTKEMISQGENEPSFTGPKILAVNEESFSLLHLCHKDIDKSWQMKSVKEYAIDWFCNMLLVSFTDGIQIELLSFNPFTIFDAIKTFKENNS